MSEDTSNYGYNRPDRAKEDWGFDLNSNSTALDKDIEVRDTGVYTRRGVLKTGAGVAAAGVAGASTAGTASAQESVYGGYLTDAGFEGTADATGNDEVTVQVGVGTSGWKFNPAAVLVEPGTTIVWEWTGNGGSHNVVHETETEFASAGEQLFNSGETVSGKGVTFEHTFENAGARQYFCNPHKGVGMKGVVAVGEDNAEGELIEYALSSGPTGLSTPVIGGAGAFGAISLLGVAVYNALVRDTDAGGSHAD
jgi:halocyanin-like protein